MPSENLAPSERFDLGPHPRQVLVASGDHHDVRPVAGDGEGDVTAHAGTQPRHHGHPALQDAIHANSSTCD